MSDAMKKALENVSTRLNLQMTSWDYEPWISELDNEVWDALESDGGAPQRWSPPTRQRSQIMIHPEALRQLGTFLLEKSDGMGYSEFIVRSLEAWRRNPSWRKDAQEVDPRDLHPGP